MCGIAGWLGSTADRDDRLAAELQASLRHRGPDDTGCERFPYATLVHTRLKILDLSEAGHQPMSSADGSVCVVFNGEIYNHRELRRELETAGHCFRGHSDTEIIPALYLEHGADFVQRLKGMFAIGVLDHRNRTLLLARDRFGIKPLFYAQGRSRIAFASEIAALGRLGDVDLRPDPQAVFDYLALHVVPAPATAFRGIRALEPGQVLEASAAADGVSCRIRRYHQWAIAPDPALSLEAATERARELLDAAVASQLESDVPLGGLLSGGIDSSLVCAAAQRAVGGTLRTFGVRFDDPAFDESDAIATVADRLGTDHEMLDFEAIDSSWEAVAGVLASPGQPFADTSLFAVHALARLVRRRVTVALSGDGGDEGFGGYDHYGRLQPLAMSLRLPPALRRLGFRAAAAGAAPLVRLGRLGTHLPGRLVDAAEARSAHELVADQLTWLRRRELGRLWAGPPAAPVARLFEPRWDHHLPDGAGPLDRLTALTTEADIRLRLANDYLPKVDAASMAASLEVRVPLLDEDLFGFALTLPTELKRSGAGASKVVLRRLAATEVPEIASLPKHGFGVPMDAWVDHEFKDRLREQLLGPASTLPTLLDREAYGPIVEAFTTSTQLPEMTRQGLYQRAFMLLALDLSLRSSATPAPPT